MRRYRGPNAEDILSVAINSKIEGQHLSDGFDFAKDILTLSI
jgi:hypothetical protein